MGVKLIPALAGHVPYQISETLEDKEAAEALRQAYIDDVFAFEKYDDCQKKGSHTVCSDGDVLTRRCKQIDVKLQKGRLHLGDK